MGVADAGEWIDVAYQRPSFSYGSFEFAARSNAFRAPCPFIDNNHSSGFGFGFGCIFLPRRAPFMMCDVIEVPIWDDERLNPKG